LRELCRSPKKVWPRSRAKSGSVNFTGDGEFGLGDHLLKGRKFHLGCPSLEAGVHGNGQGGGEKLEVVAVDGSQFGKNIWILHTCGE